MKKLTSGSYTRQFILITIVLTALIAGLFNLLFPEYYIPGYYICIIVMVILTYSGHHIMRRTLRNNPKRFSQVYMLSTMIKMFIMLIFMLVYLLIDRSQTIIFVLLNFVVYMAYTTLEVSSLKKDVKSTGQNQK